MSANLYVQETYLNATKGHIFGEGDVYESYTDSRGDLFRAMQKEYGRCTGAVYVDRSDGPPQAVGWVFISRQRYEDTDESYLREVWVTIHEAPPVKTIEYKYAS